MNNNGYIVSNSGKISLLVNSRAFAVTDSHPNYDAIREALRNNDWDNVLDLVDIPQAIRTKFQHESIAIDDSGLITYKGMPVHGVVVNRILEFMRSGEQFQPLVAFLNNIMENPSRRSVEELYGFLEHGGFPITEDGCFIAYKGVTDEYKDLHTRTFDNNVGAVHEIPRNQVDDDCRQVCSYGFHVGTQSYANQFAGTGGKLMLVKVNPRDCVAVPFDHSCEKLRVCRYEVVAESMDRVRLEEPVFASTCMDTYDDEDEDFGYCDDGEDDNETY